VRYAIRDAGAPRANRAGSGARVHDVGASIDLHFTLVGGPAGIEGHVVVRVLDNVPFDARIGGPTIHADVRVAAGASRLSGNELGGNRASLRVRYRCIAESVPLVAKATQVASRVVPRGNERGNVEGGQLAHSGVGPNFPGQVVFAAGPIA